MARSESEVINAFLAGLRNTYDIHEKLGNEGTSDFQLNQFEEISLTMDIEAENEVITRLSDLGVPLQFFSEEHGTFATGKDPEYTVPLDGLDGSAEYRTRRNTAMYGTMAAILIGDNPTYGDYLASGIMIHSPVPELFLAIKGQGCFSFDLTTGERKPVQKKTPEFSKTSIIDLDTNWPPYKKLLSDNRLAFPRMQCAFFSQAARTVLFLQGKIDVQLEWTRKGNLEQPASYALVTELGGVMLTADGKSLDSQRFRTFGQDTNVPLIIAATERVANQTIQQLHLDKF